METGLFFKWGKVVPGLEKESLDLFTDVTTYYGKKLANGMITAFEPYLVSSGDIDFNGFMIVKGPVAEIFKILEEPAFKEHTTRAYRIFEHFGWELLTVGEAIGEQLALFKKVSKV